MHALGGSSTDRARTKVTFSSALARLSWPTIADGDAHKGPHGPTEPPQRSEDNNCAVAVFLVFATVHRAATVARQQKANSHRPKNMMIQRNCLDSKNKKGRWFV